MTFGNQFTEADDAVIHQMWADKKSQTEIANVLGRNANSIAGRISRLGIRNGSKPVPNPSRRPKIWTMGDRFTLKAMHAEKASMAEVAAALGCTKRMVRNQAERLGLRFERRVMPEKPRKARAGTVKSSPTAPMDMRPMGPLPTHGVERLPVGRCQFIPGEPSPDDTCKCGLEAVPGHSYCPSHLARCYQPRQQEGEAA
jgi:hypothetical protein